MSILARTRRSCVADLLKQGYWLGQNLVSPSLVDRIIADLDNYRGQQAFRPAAIGSQQLLTSQIRGDEICWWQPESPSPTQTSLLSLINHFKIFINRNLYLGAHEIELHYAIYGSGAGYQRHLDQIRGSQRRQISFVFYLNKNWRSQQDGGELILYTRTEPVTIEPEAGTCLCFLSSEIEHEVRPARRERLSLTGWLCRPGSRVGRQ